MMSAITPQGWLFTRTRYEALNGMDSVHFLTYLRSQMDRKLLVIWDGSPIHHNADVSRPVQQPNILNDVCSYNAHYFIEEGHLSIFKFQGSKAL